MSQHSHSSLSSHNGGTGTAAKSSSHEENIINAKTPLGKNTTGNTSRRRALGDISNRKSANESLAGGHSITKSGKSAGLSTYQTPHKSRSKNSLKQILGPATSVQKSKQILSVSNVKKKAVSFAIHTESDQEVKKDEIKLKEQKWKLANQLQTRTRHDMYDDDIEVSAGRTALEERALLGDELNRVDSETARDIEEILGIAKAYKEYKYEMEMNAFANISLPDDDDLGQLDFKNDPLAQLEDIDEDVFQSYLLFDEYKSLDLDVGSDYDVDDGIDKLMACMDDISI